MPADPLVLLTRSEADSGPLVTRLRSLGIMCEVRPCVRVEQLADPAPLRDTLAALTADDLLVLTSAAGARAVELATGQAGCRAPAAAVGLATREACAAAGLRVAFMPSVPTGRALALEVPLPRGSVLLARSDRAASEPAEILSRRGALVGEVVAYRTVPIPLDRVPDAAAVVFFSPSAVEGYAASGTQPRCAIAIGPSTAQAVRSLLGIDPLIAPPDENLLAAAIKNALEESHAGIRR